MNIHERYLSLLSSITIHEVSCPDKCLVHIGDEVNFLAVLVGRQPRLPINTRKVEHPQSKGYQTSRDIATLAFSLGGKHVYDKAKQIAHSKQHDYESGLVSFLDYWPEGSRDIWLLVYGKYLRLVSLSNIGRKAVHESFEDNCADLASYALWTAVVIEHEQHQKLGLSK